MTEDSHLIGVDPAEPGSERTVTSTWIDSREFSLVLQGIAEDRTPKELFLNWPDSLISDLRRYLLAHEDDIQGYVNDFGDLNNLFKAVIG